MREQLTERARELRQNSTRAERTIWRWLRNRYLGGHKFRRQYPLDRYILDFYCAKLKLCVEVDGWSHNTENSMHYDARRTQFLATHGVTVIRLENELIDDHPDGAWSMIVAAVDKATRERRPSP